MVCWCWLAVAHEGWGLNFEEFWEPGDITTAVWNGPWWEYWHEKSANTMDGGSLRLPTATAGTAVLNRYPHTTGPRSHCPLLKNARHHGPLCKEIGRNEELSASTPASEPRPANSRLPSGPLHQGQGPSRLHWGHPHISLPGPKSVLK